MKRLLRKWRLRSLWVRQGRPRDKWVVVKRGTYVDGVLVGWHLDGRYCRDKSVAGLWYTPAEDGVLIGGYTVSEILTVPV